MEQSNRMKFVALLVFIVLVVLIAFFIYTRGGYVTNRNNVIVDHNKIYETSQSYIEGIKLIENSEVGGSSDFLKGLPAYYEAGGVGTSFTVDPLTGEKYGANELILYAKQNHSPLIIKKEVELVGGSIVGYDKDVDKYFVIFPKETSFEDFRAAELALVASNQIEFFSRRGSLSPS